MKKIYIALLTLAMISGCTKTDEEKITDLYNTGLSQISDFKYSQAEATFAKIFEINETAIEGILGQAQVKEARLFYYDALYDYIIIRQRSTDYEAAYQGQYHCYRNLGDFQKAFETAVEYQKRWKENPVSKFYLAEAAYNIMQFPRARNFYSQAIEEGVSFPDACKYGIAATYIKEGFIDSAKTTIDGLTISSTMDPETYAAAAVYYEALGEIDSAIAASNSFYNLEKSDNTSSFLHFQRCLKYDYLTDARNVITYLKEQKVDTQLTIGYNLFYALHVDAKDLIRKHGLEIRALATTGPVTGVLYHMKSRGALSDILSISQDMLKLDNDIINGLYGTEFGQFLQYKLYMLYTEYDRSPPSLKQMDNLPGMWRNRMDFKLRVALLKYVIGLFEESTADLKNLKAGHMTQPDWLAGIAEIWGHYGVRQYNTASTLFNEALKIDPYYLPAFQKHIQMLDRLKEYKKIIALYDKFPQFHTNRYLSYLKAQYYILNGQFDSGLKMFKENVSAAEGNIVYIEKLYNLLMKNKRPDSEIQILVNVLETSQKENSDALILRAKIEADKGNYDNTLALADNIMNLEPDLPDGYVIRAYALYHSGQKTAAYDLFEENSKRFVSNPTNLLYYSQVLAEEGIDYDKAANLARQATYHGYGTYKYVINLSEIYYKMGRYDLSGGEAKKAIFGDKENPYPYYRHGMALYKNGVEEKQNEAKKQLKKALEMGLSGTFKTDAENTLKKM